MLDGYDLALDDAAAYTFINQLFESRAFVYARIESWIRDNVKLGTTKPEPEA
jgi:hypothetical protein